MRLGRVFLEGSSEALAAEGGEGGDGMRVPPGGCGGSVKAWYCSRYCSSCCCVDGRRLLFHEVYTSRRQDVGGFWAGGKFWRKSGLPNEYTSITSMEDLIRRVERSERPARRLRGGVHRYFGGKNITRCRRSPDP